MSRPNRPRPVSDFVSGVAKDIFGRKSILFGKMIAEWAHVAGADIAAKTTPLDLKYSTKTDDNRAVLVLAVQPAYALEFSYQKQMLMERLNAFFGYPAVKEIKIVQYSEVMINKKPLRQPQRPITSDQQRKLDDSVSCIQESDLQTALKNLGKAILSRPEALPDAQQKTTGE